MNLTKVFLGGFVAVTSLFGLVFVGGFFLVFFPVDPLRLGSAIVSEMEIPFPVVLVVGGVVVLGAVAPILGGLALAGKGLLE